MENRSQGVIIAACPTKQHVFNTAAQAAKATEVPKSNISECLKQKRKQAGGYTFNYCNGITGYSGCPITGKAFKLNYI